MTNRYSCKIFLVYSSGTIVARRAQTPSTRVIKTQNYKERVAASRNTSSGTEGNNPSKIPRPAPRRDAAAYQALYFAFDGVKGRQGFRDPVKWW